MKQTNLDNLNLTLFFTAGTSLADWARNGNLDRELAVYRRLADRMKRVNLVTYGGRGDRLLADRLDERLHVLSARWYSRQELTLLGLMLKHSGPLLGSDIIKTNQIRGAQIALWVKSIYRKKLIVRCGFLHSYFTRRQGRDEQRIQAAVALERAAFEAADIGIVTSAWQREMVLGQYGLDPGKIRVVPNYVETGLFRPLPEVKNKYDMVFVGRADEQKNLDGLLAALEVLEEAGKEVSLLLVGGGCNSDRIRNTVKDKGLNVTFKAGLPNHELPGVLNQARVFVLPSHYEGHPKALIEAMSCGLPCIGAESSGIKEEIEHRGNGYLCGTDYRSIAEAVETVLSDSALRRTMGENARRYVCARYDIDRIVEMELEIIQELGGAG